MRPSPYDDLLPAPRELSPSPGALALAPGTRIRLAADAGLPPHARARVEGALARLELEPVASSAGARLLQLHVGDEHGLAGQTYTLQVAPDGLRLEAGGPAGALHGTATLAQLLASLEGRPPAERALPCARIDDAPAFERRGWMLDVSRDRVPTRETLERLVDLLADWKGNELQLYMEHTFAFADHREVWEGTGALTADELRDLDAYCAARGVELVPNQNCLGHLHHWLRLPRYRELAEVPAGVEHPFSADPEPFSLCPTDPASLRFVSGLLDELLPCFSSGEVNVGLDETFDLGQGRSADAARARGVGRVYLDYLRDLHTDVRGRGLRMQFWADVLLEHPELVDEVPREAVALLWGYEAAHPFEKQAAAVAASGLEFHVCPGTSSWQSLAGRTANLLGNLDAAVRAGREHGARGLLVADWGDRGHLQPEWASLPGWALGLGLAWNDAPPPAQDPRDPEQLARLLDVHAFRDEAGVLGALVLALGRSGEVTGARAANASPLSLLLTAFDGPFPPTALEGLTDEGLGAAQDHLRRCLDDLPRARSRRPDAELLEQEIRWAAAVLDAAARLGRVRLASGPALGTLPAAEGEALVDELQGLAAAHRRLWVHRCRPGGLERSAAWLERPAEALRGARP